MQNLGATLAGVSCQFRVWAPQVPTVFVEFADLQRRVPLESTAGGYHAGIVEGIGAGQRYRFVVNDCALPDPCSRYQPEGPHGESMVVDRHAHVWSDGGWLGIELSGLVLYELHIGTFTAAGTFDAAIAHLPHLRALGVTAVEIMPVAECAGRFNWGYDGVCWFAPSHNYGPYDAFKRFVDAAHAAGIGVLLDVVYNHFGPEGNYAPQFSPFYTSSRPTEWGEAINYDGEQCAAVRELVIANAREWVGEFHLDGLRLDATQSMFDGRDPHVIAEIVAAARAAAAGRSILLIAENEPQKATHLLPASDGGLGLDALWNDDFHHTARVAATRRRDAYFFDYLGSPQEFVSTAKRGFLYQGQHYRWQKQSRGQPLARPVLHCIAYLQNHDQVANSLAGLRLQQITSLALWRALTAVLLLGPQTPMLFMGQEFAASTPFLFFADQQAELRRLVRDGRRDFLSQLPGVASADGLQALPDPGDEQTFLRSKLDWRECDAHESALRLHRDLLELRRTDAVIQQQGSAGFDGAVLGPEAFALRWFSAAGDDRLLLVNLGADIRDRPMPEPLLAPPLRRRWSLRWSSEAVAYGGGGSVDPVPDAGWLLPGQCAMLLAACAGDPR